MILVGIDPDLRGGIAVVSHPDRKVLLCSYMPVLEPKPLLKQKRRLDVSTLWGHLIYARGQKATHVILEAAVVKFQRGGQMTGGIDTTHQTYGAIRALAELAYGPNRVIIARPSVWKKQMKIGSDKDKARALALENYPSHEKVLKLKKATGIAEAMLLTEWGLGRVNLNSQMS